MGTRSARLICHVLVVVLSIVFFFLSFGRTEGEEPDLSAVPEELREYMVQRYRSKKLREIVADAFRGLAKHESFQEQCKSAATLFDLGDERISLWLLVNKRFSYSVLQYDQGVTEREIIPLIEAILHIVWDDGVIKPLDEGSNPHGVLDRYCRFLSQAVGVAHKPPEESREGYYHRTPLYRWCLETLDRALQDEEKSPQTKSWLRYCRERIVGSHNK